MLESAALSSQLSCFPLTPDRWQDFESLFGVKGAYGGCWCMFWRLPSAEFKRHGGEENKGAMHELVHAGVEPGLLAYDDQQPVGWIALGPRESFPRLASSRVLKAVDDQPVWSIVCFFVAKPFRRKHITAGLIQAGLDYARQHGAKIVEAYPIDPKTENYPSVYAYTGWASVFRSIGFVEILRRSDTRPIMRYKLEETPPKLDVKNNV